MIVTYDSYRMIELLERSGVILNYRSQMREPRVECVGTQKYL